MKFVSIIAIVAVAMIGLMVPSAFADTESEPLTLQQEYDKILSEMKIPYALQGGITNPVYESETANQLSKNALEIAKDSGLAWLDAFRSDNQQNKTKREFCKILDSPYLTTEDKTIFLKLCKESLEWHRMVMEKTLDDMNNNFVVAEMKINNLNISDDQKTELITKLRSDEKTVIDMFNIAFTDGFKRSENFLNQYKLVTTSKPTLSFVDLSKDPSHYIERYLNEPKYKEWFDENFPDYTIYEGIGISHEEYILIIDELTTSVEPELTTSVEPELTTSVEPELSEIEYIKNNFYSNIRGIISTNEFTEQDFEKWKIFMGEDRYKKLISLYEKYDIPVLPNGIPIGSSQIDPQLLTLEEQFFIIEIFENYNKFFKQFMSERVMKIEDSFLETEKQIDNLDIPEKEKSQHIQEIFQYKEVMIKGIVNTVSKPLVTEEQIIESKKKLELEAELRGISLESIEMSDESTYTFEPEPSESGGGCLIATAAYGSEMATEVQQLRELRDNQLLQTESGVAFMGTFNDIYYSFSPIIADYERENPYFKEAVKIAITPMISSLSLMENANSESEVLSIGISVIALNIGMYLGIPVIAIVGLRRII